MAPNISSSCPSTAKGLGRVKMSPHAQRQTHKYVSRDGTSLPRCGSANRHVLRVRGRRRTPKQYCTFGLAPTQDFFLLDPDCCMPGNHHHFSFKYLGAHFTNYSHSRGCTGTLGLLGIKQFPNMKSMTPSATGDQPTCPAAKHSLCMGRPSGNSSGEPKRAAMLTAMKSNLSPI